MSTHLDSYRTISLSVPKITQSTMCCLYNQCNREVRSPPNSISIRLDRLFAKQTRLTAKTHAHVTAVRRIRTIQSNITAHISQASYPYVHIWTGDKRMLNKRARTHTHTWITNSAHTCDLTITNISLYLVCVSRGKSRVRATVCVRKCVPTIMACVCYS